METERLQTEVLVAGGGVIGLAIAREQALAGREVIVLERGEVCGRESSTRNNQVVHAGFLYPPGSLKSELCRRGHDLLLGYAAEKSIGHRIAPKLMLAIDDADCAVLAQMQANAVELGLNEIRHLDATVLRGLEPSIRARSALLSPDTAIIDTHELILTLEADVIRAGGLIATRTHVTGGAPAGAGYEIAAQDAQGQRLRISSHWVVNAAGLGAEELSSRLGEQTPDIHFARGQFLAHKGPTGLEHLVVPVGAALGAGASLTTDMNGNERFGPDLQFVSQRDYSLAEPTANTLAAIRSWWPDLDSHRLLPDYAGIRPRLTGPGKPPGDWHIASKRHGLIDLLGIDTPGLTACLSIAAYVGQMIDATQHSHRRVS